MKTIRFLVCLGFAACVSASAHAAVINVGQSTQTEQRDEDAARKALERKIREKQQQQQERAKYDLPQRSPESKLGDALKPGEPTTLGRWRPRYLNGQLCRKGRRLVSCNYL
jgi:hypothetical protein